MNILLRKTVPVLRTYWHKLVPCLVGLVGLSMAYGAGVTGEPGERHALDIGAMFFVFYAVGLAYERGNVRGQQEWACRLTSILLEDRFVEITVTHQLDGQTIKLPNKREGRDVA